MTDNKISMPTSTAGITRYDQDYKSKIQFKPYYIIAFVILILLLVYILNAYGPAWLGIPPLS